MSVPRDGDPVLSPTAETLRREFLSRPRNVALVLIRRRGCGCALGSVYRLPSGDLLIGRRRPVVQRTATTAQAREQRVFLALDDVDEVVLMGELSCEDGGVRLPLNDVREAADAAAAGRRKIGAPLTL